MLRDPIANTELSIEKIWILYEFSRFWIYVYLELESVSCYSLKFERLHESEPFKLKWIIYLVAFIAHLQAS